MERFGFVGLPNAGKSSLYNALAGGGALAAPYAFATVDPNVGVAKVLDSRLDALAEMSKSKNVIPTAVQFVDIAGLVKGASQGEGLGNRFLAHIREVDATVFVLRAFEDTDVPGSSDPAEQLEILELELITADLEAMEKHIDKRRKAARSNPVLAPEVAAMEAAIDVLGAGTPVWRAGLGDDTLALLKAEQLLTSKPVIVLVNLGEDQLEEPDAHLAGVRELVGDTAPVIGLSIQLEAEAAMLDAEDRVEMLDALGLGEGALPTFLHTAYQLLGLRTFFTTGEKESRAWTFRAGSTAPQAAGVIHTDFERGFVKAEIVSFDELVELGSMADAKAAGKVRMEGKDYVMQDGDVVEFRTGLTSKR